MNEQSNEPFTAVRELLMALGDQGLLARLLGVSTQDIAELSFGPLTRVVAPLFRARAEYLLGILARPMSVGGPGNYARFWLDVPHPQLSADGIPTAPLDIMRHGWSPAEVPLRLLWRAEGGDAAPWWEKTELGGECEDDSVNVGVIAAHRQS